MYASPRTLRRGLQQIDRTPHDRTARQQARHDHITRATQHAMVQQGRHAVCMRNLALALGMCVATLRRYILDLDMFLHEILRDHLRALGEAVSAIPADTPDGFRQRRAAYHAFTHTALGGLTDLHLLLTRDRHTLPAEDRDEIDRMRADIGETLGAGDCSYEALLLLDAPYIELDRIEQMLARPPAAATTASPEPAAPKPEPKPPAVTRPLRHTQPDQIDAPGAWIYSAGIPNLSRHPPVPAPVLSG
jgi:AcrR family transcriptional regulator